MRRRNVVFRKRRWFKVLAVRICREAKKDADMEKQR